MMPEPGAGMGLGLYLVRRAIEPAGGRLTITPREPCGTRVALIFEENCTPDSTPKGNPVEAIA